MGYEDALRKHKLPVDPRLSVVCDTVELAREIIPELLTQSPPPDAIFCVNDEVAAYCTQFATSIGIKIPDDLSVCGFTNSYLTEVTYPQLTSVDQHGYKMGKTATQLLINRIEGKETKSGIVSRLIKTELVVRGSTKS